MMRLFCVSLGLFTLYGFFLPALFLIIPVLAKKLAVKSISDMIYLVLCGMLNLNLISQLSSQLEVCNIYISRLCYDVCVCL